MKDRSVLAGNLSFLGLGDILQLLGSSNCTGVLRLANPYVENAGYIYFENGNPINSMNGNIKGLDALYSLFGWREGTFEFVAEDVVYEKTITKNRMGIILEGVKMLDDGKTKEVGSRAKNHVVKQNLQGPEDKMFKIVKGPLVDYMYVVDEDDFFDGEHIVEEGRHGGWLWVILGGVVEIRKETEKGQLSIMRIGDGSFIGSVSSFLHHGNIRSATAVAVGNVQLGVLDAQRLAQEYSELSPEFKTFLVSLDNRLKSATDYAARYGGSKKPITPYTIKDKKVRIRQGQQEDSLYVIERGKVDIVKTIESGDVVLGTLKKGDFFGHMPFIGINHEPEYASIIASKNTKIGKADAMAFRKEYDDLSMTFANLVDNLSTCVSTTVDVICDFSRGIGPGQEKE